MGHQIRHTFSQASGARMVSFCVSTHHHASWVGLSFYVKAHHHASWVGLSFYVKAHLREGFLPVLRVAWLERILPIFLLQVLGHIPS